MSMDGGLKCKIRSIFYYHESYLGGFGKDSVIFRNFEVNKNKTTVNWAQLSNRRYVDTDMLPGSYPHRKYMVCMLGNIIFI